MLHHVEHEEAALSDVVDGPGGDDEERTDPGEERDPLARRDRRLAAGSDRGCEAPQRILVRNDQGDDDAEHVQMEMEGEDVGGGFGHPGRRLRGPRTSAARR